MKEIKRQLAIDGKTQRENGNKNQKAHHIVSAVDDKGLCLETVRCVFTLPEGEAVKHRMTHDGQETYAFILSNKYILGLFTHCEAARKSVVMDGVGFGHLTEQEQKIVLLDGVGDVLFQALLLDDVEYGNDGLSANLYTIYCLNKKE